MNAALPSVIRLYFPDKYSHFCFSFEPRYYEMGGSKFLFVAYFPAMEGKNRCAKVRVVHFPRGNSQISMEGGILLYSHFFGRKVYY